MREVAAHRTRFHTFVLDGVHKPHNVGAILRTLDAFGFQDVFILEKPGSRELGSEVSKGSAQWLTLNLYSNENPCWEALKSRGYRIAITHKEGVDFRTLDWSLPTAVVLGAELTGVSEASLERADCRVRIPMWGFVESLNVSVAAGILASHLREELETRHDSTWKFSSQEQTDLVEKWKNNLVIDGY
jgi:tRNA (guanosine-2'-O-)-methyltransferase